MIIYSNNHSNSSLIIILPVILLLSTLTFLFILFFITYLIIKFKLKSLNNFNKSNFRQLTRLTPYSNNFLSSDNDYDFNSSLPVDLTDMDFDNGLANWARDEPGGQQSAIQSFINNLSQPQLLGLQRSRGAFLFFSHFFSFTDIRLDYQTLHPPASLQTAITLSQYLTIQEKGVSAWSFEPDYEALPPILVQARTELTFLADGEGLSPSEGGACSVQTNLPIPRTNDTYYWEVKLFEISPGTSLSFGLATKPYPSFRLPG